MEKREEGRWGRSGLISPSAATVTREKKETWPQPLVGRIPSSFICSMSCVALLLKLTDLFPGHVQKRESPAAVLHPILAQRTYFPEFNNGNDQGHRRRLRRL